MDDEAFAALQARVAVLEACLAEIEHKLKIKRRPGAVPPSPLPPPLPPPPPESAPRVKRLRRGTPAGPAYRQRTPDPKPG